MSIVISSLEKNIDVNIFADRKMVVTDLFDNIVHEVTVIKIFQISDDLACGVTGDYHWGIALKNELLKNRHKLPSQLIELIQSFDKEFKVNSTFSLIGIYDDGRLFLYGFNTENGTGEISFENAVLIAVAPIEYNDTCLLLYKYLKGGGHTNEHSSIEIIKFASRLDPKHISEDFDRIQIKLKNNNS